MGHGYALGVEFGSTRIKAVLIDESSAVVARGSHLWENQLVDGRWSYALDAVWAGLADAVAQMADDFETTHGEPLHDVASIGVSAMMHGYLAFDATGSQLVAFRTWRNTSTARASAALTAALSYPMPQRWSVAHLFQAVLDHEPHVPRVDFLTTLAGYVHWRLTGQRVLGVGDASGMFPIDAATHDWDAARLEQAQQMLDARDAGLSLRGILPEVRVAGAPAGRLTERGARLLDPAGRIPAGTPCCPPEGDAGTGMVATNAVTPRTGNVSVGTSIFAMVVLERPLSAVHTEIDLVTTPAGDPVAMVHCNNGASELDAWAKVFGQFAAAAGHPVTPAQTFGVLYEAAVRGEPDGGGLLAYNYLAGEPIVGLEEGRPLVARTPDSRLTLENLARVLLMSSYSTLCLGMRVLGQEGVGIDSMRAQGGVFATPGAAQRLLAAAFGVPVTVADTASDGGAWGMAVLAAFAADSRGLDLTGYLARVVFVGERITQVAPVPGDEAGNARFLDDFEAGLAMQRAVVSVWPRKGR
jgi:sugar (pentulose or hexulose) kinase